MGTQSASLSTTSDLTIWTSELLCRSVIKVPKLIWTSEFAGSTNFLVQMSGQRHSDRSSFFILLTPTPNCSLPTCEAVISTKKVLFRVDFLYKSQYKQVSSPQAAACVRGEAYEPYNLMIRWFSHRYNQGLDTRLISTARERGWVSRTADEVNLLCPFESQDIKWGLGTISIRLRLEVFARPGNAASKAWFMK